MKLTKTRFKLSTITCSQARLLPLSVLANLIVSRTPAASWLTTIAFDLALFAKLTRHAHWSLTLLAIGACCYQYPACFIHLAETTTYLDRFHFRRLLLRLSDAVLRNRRSHCAKGKHDAVDEGLCHQDSVGWNMLMTFEIIVRLGAMCAPL